MGRKSPRVAANLIRLDLKRAHVGMTWHPRIIALLEIWLGLLGHGAPRPSAGLDATRLAIRYRGGRSRPGRPRSCRQRASAIPRDRPGDQAVDHSLHAIHRGATTRLGEVQHHHALSRPCPGVGAV